MLKKNYHTKTILPAQGHHTAGHHYSVLFFFFIPVLVFDFWFVQNPWFPDQTQEFDKVKGDTLLSIRIAGEKSWLFTTLCLIGLAFLCVTLLTGHTLLYDMHQLHSGYVKHSVGVKSLHVFFFNLCDWNDVLPNRKLRTNPDVKKNIKRCEDFFPMSVFENARWTENETCHLVSTPFHFKKTTFLCHRWATRERNRRGNQLPGGLPVYISHLTYCKCYNNIFPQRRFNWSINRKLH